MDSEKRLRNWAKFWEKEDAAVAFDLEAGADALAKVKRVHEIVRALDWLDDVQPIDPRLTADGGLF